MSLYERMKTEVTPAMQKELGLKSLMAVPVIEKVKLMWVLAL